MFSSTILKNFFVFLFCRYERNPLPNDKILDVIKLKAFTDDKLEVAKMTIYLFDREENTVGEGENAGY